MGNYNAKRNEMAKYAYREICLYQKLAEINKFDINAICLDDEWEEVPLCSKQKLHMNLANMLNPRYILLENNYTIDMFLHPVLLDSVWKCVGFWRIQKNHFCLFG